MPDRYLHVVRSLLQQHIPQAEVWAYGSRVNGNCHEASDLNLVARFQSTTKSGAFLLSKLREALTESNLPIFVQIIDWDDIPDSFKGEIVVGYVGVQSNSI